MENKFYNELSKFKKVEKIELALLDDLKINVNSLSSNESILDRVANDMVQINSQMVTILPKAKDRAKVGKSMVDATKDKIQLAEKNIAKAKQAAKDLGVNVNDIKHLKELDKLMQNNLSALRTVEFYQSAMENIAKLKLI
tara:strand:- start:48 stop:467 length:420 start_codon:yes stop_codon:yes gene_type:complete